MIKYLIEKCKNSNKFSWLLSILGIILMIIIALV